MRIFNEQHEMFRAMVRAFVDKEIAPHIEEWKAAGRMPPIAPCATSKRLFRSVRTWRWLMTISWRR